MRNVALVILDWFWNGSESLEKNAVLRAKTPTIDRLRRESDTSLEASGLAVWVPDGQMGNSEIGHMAIGGGRILPQSIVRIGEAFRSGAFEGSPEFRSVRARAETNGRIHLMGLLGPGGVHAHTDHLAGMLAILPENVRVNLHLFADGRDTDPKSFLGYLESLMESTDAGHVKIASICGRYYAMDRDTNWERTEKAYRAIMGQTETVTADPVSFVRERYAAWTTDEFLDPVSFTGRDPIESGDAVVFLNFRSDRAKQLARAFTDPGFDRFERGLPDDFLFAAMTRYSPEFSGTVFLEDAKPDDFLGETLSKAGVRHLHIAETEKFAHVTKFFNGGRGTPFDGETDLLVPSHKVATYDLDPAMSAAEILEAFRENEAGYPFVVMNFANGDMVGHTGDMDAAVRAVETLDSAVAALIEHCGRTGRDLLITADHGNVEDMGTPDAPMTAHTCNPVPFWHVRSGSVLPTRPSWWLSDIAPTVLDLMGIAKPEAMTGTSLVTSG